MVEWRRSKPTEPGMYLRSNPPISHIVRQDVVEMDGRLMTMHGWGAGRVLVDLDDLPDRFWWYGPIPQSPWKDVAVEAEQVVGSVE